MKAILLAAGEGKRMRPLTLETPKPMIEVVGKPLLHHLIDGLPSEITELIMVIGYKGEQIKKYFGSKFEGRTVKYVIQKKQIGNADALELCKPFIKKGERFLFMFTDDLHSPKAIKALLKHDIGTLVQEHPDPSRFGVFEVDKNNRVISMEEKPKHPKSNLVAVGVYVLDTRIFDYKVRQSVNGEYFMTDQIDQLIKDHKFVIEKTDFWHPIGYPHDVDAAEKILRSRSVTHDTPLIILAGGKGTRMPESEKSKPKLMAEIGKKFMLERQVEWAQSQGFKNVILSLGYMSEQIISWLKEKKLSHVRYVVEDKPLGTGGGIKLAVQHFGIKTPFIAINGDDIADVNYEGLVRHGSGVKGKIKYNVVTGMEIDDARIYGSIECDEHKKVCAFKEKDPSSMKAMVNIGHYYLKPEIFDNTPDVFSIERDIFPKLAKQGKLVLMKHMGNYWFGCGTPETLLATRDYFSKSH